MVAVLLIAAPGCGSGDGECTQRLRQGPQPAAQTGLARASASSSTRITPTSTPGAGPQDADGYEDRGRTTVAGLRAVDPPEGLRRPASAVRRPGRRLRHRAAARARRLRDDPRDPRRAGPAVNAPPSRPPPVARLNATITRRSRPARAALVGGGSGRACSPAPGLLARRARHGRRASPCGRHPRWVGAGRRRPAGHDVGAGALACSALLGVGASRCPGAGARRRGAVRVALAPARGLHRVELRVDRCGPTTRAPRWRARTARCCTSRCSSLFALWPPARAHRGAGCSARGRSGSRRWPASRLLRSRPSTTRDAVRRRPPAEPAGYPNAAAAHVADGALAGGGAGRRAAGAAGSLRGVLGGRARSCSPTSRCWPEPRRGPRGADPALLLFVAGAAAALRHSRRPRADRRRGRRRRARAARRRAAAAADGGPRRPGRRRCARVVGAALLAARWSRPAAAVAALGAPPPARRTAARARRRGRWSLAAGSVLALVGGLAVAGNPVDRARQTAGTRSRAATPRAAAGSRLLSGLGSNRYDFYRVALDVFADPSGRGRRAPTTSSRTTSRRGRSRETPRYPHSLELRTLAQTGLVGALLLFGALGAALVAALAGDARAARTPLRGGRRGRRHAAFAYWVVHGSADWFWECAGLGAPAFALLGARLRAGPRAAASAGRRAAPRRRGVRCGGRPARRCAAGWCSSPRWPSLAAAVRAPWLAEREMPQRRARLRDAPAGGLRPPGPRGHAGPARDRPAARCEGSIALRFGDLARARPRVRAALERNPRRASTRRSSAARSPPRAATGRAPQACSPGRSRWRRGTRSRGRRCASSGGAGRSTSRSSTAASSPGPTRSAADWRSTATLDLSVVFL